MQALRGFACNPTDVLTHIVCGHYTTAAPEYARDTEKIPPSVFLPLIGPGFIGKAQQVVGGDIVVFTQRGKTFNSSTSGAAFNFTDVALSCSDNQAEISLIYVGL